MTFASDNEDDKKVKVGESRALRKRKEKISTSTLLKTS